MSDDPFEQTMLILDAAYPSRDERLTPELGAVYRLTLADLPPDALRRGAIAHIQAAKFFPSVAELRQAAEAAMTADERDRVECLRYWRTYLPHGICPHHWDTSALRRACALLNLPAPSSAALARCEENNRRHQEMSDEQRAAWATLPSSPLDTALAALSAQQRPLLGAA
jgi:hypothetical protein